LGELHIGPVPLAPFLHFAVAFGLMVFLKKFLSVKKSVIIVGCLIVLKELLDIFAKSRIEYIIPPDIDTPIDIIAGAAGIWLSFKIRKPRIDQRI